jgi:NitT/TauT family transport system substrate-binding protein
MNLVRVAVLALSTIAAMGVPAKTILAADKVRVSLAATDDPAYLPNFVAIDKGYYRELNLDVDVVHLGGGIATPALLSESIDFSTSTGSATSAVLAGAKLKIVMTLSESVPWKLWAARPEIKTLQDLKGKPVGIQSRGDLFELSMRALLMKAGLNGDSVVYMPLGFGNAQRLGVIQTGSLPAVLLSNFEEKIARERGLLERAHMLVDLGKEIRVPNNGLATSDKLLATNPSVVERFIRATLMGVWYTKSQREGTLRMFAKRVPDVSLDVLRESIDETATMMLESGTTSLATQQSEIALRNSMNDLTLQRVPAPGGVFNYSLAIEAVRRLKASNWMPTE